MKSKRALRSPSGFGVPRSSSSLGSARAGALCLIAASAMACGNKATPTPDKEPPSSASTAAIVAPTAKVEEAPAIPTLAMELYPRRGPAG
jgi:hypothetical protein